MIFLNKTCNGTEGITWVSVFSSSCCAPVSTIVISGFARDIKSLQLWRTCSCYGGILIYNVYGDPLWCSVCTTHWKKYFCSHKSSQKNSVNMNNLTASFSNNLQRAPLWVGNPDWSLDTKGYLPTQSALPTDSQSQAWRHVPALGIFGNKNKNNWILLSWLHRRTTCFLN